MQNEIFSSYLNLCSKLTSVHSFLTDYETIQFIKNSKVLFINRGIPGSGKSTLAREIVRVYGKQNTELCEGDEFFTNELGVYKYVRDKINECREYTQNRVRNACKSGKSIVIADDTHLTYAEIEPYLDIAKEFNYLVLLVEPRSPHKFDIDKLYENCKHNVSKPTLKKKLDDFELIFPSYYAWYLNETDSVRIVNLAQDCFDQAIKLINNLEEDFSNLKQSLSSNLFEYPNRLKLHCTAKYIGTNYLTSRDYILNLCVNESLGKVFKLELCGFSVSSRSIAADVRLKKVDDLWDNDLNEEERLEVLELDDLNESLFDKLKYADRAHLTIGLEKNLKAYKSGIDLVRVKLLKKSKKSKKFENDLNEFYYFDKCFCYIKFKKSIHIQALFSGFY